MAMISFLADGSSPEGPPGGLPAALRGSGRVLQGPGGPPDYWSRRFKPQKPPRLFENFLGRPPVVKLQSLPGIVFLNERFGTGSRQTLRGARRQLFVWISLSQRQAPEPSGNRVFEKPFGTGSRQTLGGPGRQLLVWIFVFPK